MTTNEAREIMANLATFRTADLERCLGEWRALAQNAPSGAVRNLAVALMELHICEVNRRRALEVKIRTAMANLSPLWTCPCGCPSEEVHRENQNAERVALDEAAAVAEGVL